MNITFDRKADALYIKLRPSRRVKKTMMLREGLLVDVDNSGKIFGIEILDASRRIPIKELSRITSNLTFYRT